MITNTFRGMWVERAKIADAIGALNTAADANKGFGSTRLRSGKVQRKHCDDYAEYTARWVDGRELEPQLETID